MNARSKQERIDLLIAICPVSPGGTRLGSTCTRARTPGAILLIRRATCDPDRSKLPDGPVKMVDDGSLCSGFWARPEGELQPLPKLLDMALTAYPSPTGGQESASELFTAMNCPPFDRLRAATVPEAFGKEEPPFQLWAYQMRTLGNALLSFQGRDALQAGSLYLHSACFALQSSGMSRINCEHKRALWLFCVLPTPYVPSETCSVVRALETTCLLQDFLSEHCVELFRAWICPQERWSQAAKDAGLQHNVSTWLIVQPIATAALDSLPGREAVHFLPQLSSILTAAAVHCQRCIQALSFRAERAAAVASDGDEDASDFAEGLNAAADESAVTGVMTHADMTAWFVRRGPGLMDRLRRKNVAFVEDVCMFVRHVLVAQACPPCCRMLSLALVSRGLALPAAATSSARRRSRLDLCARTVPHGQI